MLFQLLGVVVLLVFGGLNLGAGGVDALGDAVAIAILQGFFYVGMVLGPLVAARKGRGLVAEFALRFRWWDVPLGFVAGPVVQLGVVLLYLPFSGLLDREELGEPARQLARTADDTVGVIALAVVVVLCAPLVEELFFRGLLLGALRKRGLSDWPAVLVSSAVFGVAHFQPLQLPALFAFGVVSAWLVLRTGRLGPSIFMHMSFNGITMLALYLSGDLG